MALFHIGYARILNSALVTETMLTSASSSRIRSEFTVRPEMLKLLRDDGIKSVCWISVRNGKVYRRFILSLTPAQYSLLSCTCPSGIEHRGEDSGGIRGRRAIAVGGPL